MAAFELIVAQNDFFTVSCANQRELKANVPAGLRAEESRKRSSVANPELVRLPVVGGTRGLVVEARTYLARSERLILIPN